MKEIFKPGVYLLNIAFLFYTLIGPVKTFYHFLSNSSDLANLSQIEYIVKVRLDKKYVTKKDTVEKIAKHNNLFTDSSWEFLNTKIKFFNELVETKIKCFSNTFNFSKKKIPLHLLFENLRV